ncbi:hypothetical protein [Larkinella rosea]|uniref:Uncharacterized protein n=1 Tax=Larkinella rosea TaxID=2025312 RepID=A0A3P1BKI2_9BACT|nr:hypothetical protein [Larkinella rosea]RRB01174.1 hypothetical protein EHT25_23660 [Larkinella rosea]
MEKIYLTKRYIRKPGKAIALLLSIVILFEVFGWTLHFEKKVAQIRHFGGPLAYLYIVLRGGIFPELVTLIMVLFLVELTHTALKIYTVRFSLSAILRYEITFLPVMALAFFFFNPITQSVRYLLVNFPVYDLATYWDTYIIATYSLKMYFNYLIPVLLIGYISINLSLLSDLLRDVRIWKYRNAISG